MVECYPDFVNKSYLQKNGWEAAKLDVGYIQTLNHISL